MIFRLGYDFIDDDPDEAHIAKFGTDTAFFRPNGTLNYDKAVRTAFSYLLPQWIGDLVKAVGHNYRKLSIDKCCELTINDPKYAGWKWIYTLEPLGDPRGWFGYEQGWYDGTKRVKIIDSLLSGISEKALNSIRKEEALLCVWHAQEAPEIPNLNLWEEFHKELKSKNINPSNFLFVIGNLKAKNQYRYWKKNSKYKNDKNINIIELSVHRHAIHTERIQWKWKEFAQFDENKKINKKFLLFQRSIIAPHRMLLLTMLYERGLISSGMISCRKIEPEDYEIFRQNLRVHFNFWGGKYEDRIFVNEKLKTLKEIEPMTPMIVDVENIFAAGGTGKDNHAETLNIFPYEQTLFSLISETNFTQNTLFITQSTWKAVLNRHPFIIAGNPGVIKYLRNEGFKTFHPYIDESYDEIKNPYKRMVMIIDEVERLSKLNDEESKQFLINIRDIVDYNYDKLLSDKKRLDKLVKELTRRIKL